MSEKYANIHKLTHLLSEISEGWSNQNDKTNEMKEIINILKDITLKSSIEEYFNKNENDINYFMNDFIDTLIEFILNQPYVTGNDGDDIALELLFQIYKLFSVFHKQNYFTIFESIRKIFKVDNTVPFFYPQNTIKKLGMKSNIKKRYIFSKFNTDFCSEFINNKEIKVLYKVGDKVDILINNNNSETDLERAAWVRGIITKIENGLYYIEYNGENNEITFPIGSQRVQLWGKKTEDWDWRTNLKKYDLVDVYDRETWWPCTICDVIEKTDVNGIKKVKYKIGFRLYLDHFNNPNEPNDSLFEHASFWKNINAQVDDEGQEFIGDNKENDEEIYHFSKRIQKFNSYSEIQKISKEGGEKEFIATITNELVANDNIPEDIKNDYLLYEINNKKNIIIGKQENSENFSYYFAMLLKKIENNGDFEKFIDYIFDSPNKEEIFTFFTIYNSAINYIHPAYFENNKDILKGCFFNFIEKLDSNEIKNLPKDLVETATNFLNEVFRNTNIPKYNNSNNAISLELMLNITFKKIRTKIFDKILEGIKELNDIINKNQNNSQNLEIISNEIKKSRILEDEIFGPNYHSQIISKAKEPIKILLKYKNLDENILRLIMSCKQKGQIEEKVIIISIFDDLINNYDDEFIGKLLDELISIRDRPIEKETQFVYQLSLKNKSEENKKKISQYFCKSIFELTTFSRENPVFAKLIKLMKNDKNYLIKVLEICEEHYKKNDHILICNSLISELFSNFITMKPDNQNQPYECSEECLSNFIKDEHLIKLFEDNFSDYITIAKEKYNNKKISTIDQIFIDGYNHSKNIDGRLAFLKMIISNLFPNYDFIFKLKELLIDKPVIPEDKKYFYRFMDEFFFPRQGKKIINNDIRDKMKNELFDIFAEKDQTDMNHFEFTIFIKTFFHLNKAQLNYKVVFKDREEFDYEIKLKQDTKYDEIKKIDILWKMIFEVKDDIVLNKLINVIYQIVQDESIILKNMLGVKEINAELIKKFYKLLKRFFIESEKNMLINIKSHNSLLKNAIIKFPLRIVNDNNNDNSNDIIEFFYDNASLNDIKELLMKKYLIPIEYIETYLKKEDCKIELNYTYNNKSLKEIIFEEQNQINNNKKINFNEIILFLKKNIDKNRLIYTNGVFTPKFKSIIGEWYKEFTQNDNKLMDKQNFARFISRITNKNATNNVLISVFKKYDKENNGFLTEENFFKCYINDFMQNNNFNNVWTHLKNMKYNDYLYKIDNTQKIEYTKNENIFRFRLCDDDFINMFIEHFNNFPEIDYELLFYLPTNKKIYEDILYKFNYDSNLFDDVFKSNDNILKQLYYLIIIESFLQDIELNNIDIRKIFYKNNKILELKARKYEPFDNYNIEDKIKFVEDFIKNNKNYEKLIQYNIDMLNKYVRSQNELMKKCLRKGLKIMRIIFESFLDYNPNNRHNMLTDDNIYYLDYIHINYELKDKNDTKEIILNYSFSNIFKSIINYLIKNSNNNVDELNNDCFEIILKFLAFKEKLLNEFLSDEKKKKAFSDLIIQNISFNSSGIIKSLTNTLKKLSYIINDSNNQFLKYFYDLMNSIFNSEGNQNLLLSNDIFEFLSEINNCLSNIKNDPDNKILFNIIEMLIKSADDIDNNNDTKIMPKEIFIKYIKLLTNLIDKDSKTKQIIASYKINDETLSSILIEKIILSDLNAKKRDPKNTNANDSKDFVLIRKNGEEEDDEKINQKLKEECKNYILSCLRYNRDQDGYKEIIRINRIIKEKLEKELNNNINNNSNSNNNNKGVNKNKNGQSKSLKVFGHLGLHNLGSICYMNSIMQQLYMIPTFRYAIMGVDDKDPINPTLKYKGTDENLLHQLQVMFSYLNLSEEKFFNPEYFCKAFKDIDGKPTNPKEQKDSMEFFNYFCDKIENLLKGTKYKYIINDVFAGKTCSSVICDSCHHISNTFESIYNLTVEIENINNLNESLKNYITPETVNGYRCSGCDKKLTIQKITSLCKLPNVIFIHLKRFKMNYDFYQTIKINSEFIFPEKINLKDFCVEKLQQQENESDNIYFKKEEYYEYILKGINVHMGNANGGHYISFIDINRDGKGNVMKQLAKNEKPNWLKFNDSNVTEYNINNIPYDCFGGKTRDNRENTQNAYLLIYERVQKTPIRIVVEENTISEEQKNEAIKYKKDDEESIYKKYDISKINNEIKEEDLYKLIFHNEENNEYYKYVSFYNLPKYAPKYLYNKIKYENKLLLRENLDKEEEIKSNEDFVNEFVDKLYKLISKEHFNEDIKKYNASDQNDIFNILIFNIFQKAKKDNLSEEEITMVNKNMKKIINNIIKPLTDDDNTNTGILENIHKSLLTKNNIEIIFTNDKPVFEANIVKDIYVCITNLNKVLNFKNPISIFNICDIFLNYFKKIKSSSQYNGSNKTNPIKYVYNIIKDLIEKQKDFKTKCVEENLILLLISGIEKEYSENQTIIFSILDILIKQTEDYNEKLFILEKNENNNKQEENRESNNKPQIKYKNQLREIFKKNKVVELFFDQNRDLLTILIKIFEYKDKEFTDGFNVNCLPSLMDFAIKNDQLIHFIDLCYNIIDIKDDLCMVRMKQLIGYPTMVIKPKIKGDNKQKWPIFGAELIKKNNNDLKTEIYKYISFYKKKQFCILSYLLPYSSGNNDILFNKDKVSLIYKLILKCLSSPTNYYIFKYLYLLPARSLYYNNAYEELIEIIKDDSSYDLNTVSDIEHIFIQKINYELNEIYKKRYPNRQFLEKINNPEIPDEISENNPNMEFIEEFLGFNPDFIPGEIVKEEIQTIIHTKYLKLIRIEYYTTFYGVDDLKKMINDKKEISLDNKTEKDNKEIDMNEKIDEKEKLIKVDISNQDYQIEEDKLFMNLSNKFDNKLKKIIIEDGTIAEDDNVINSLIRYIFVNNKPINNKMNVKIGLKKDLKVHIKDNVCVPEFLLDYVEKENYVDFLDINRIKQDEKLLEKDDIFISIKSKAYLNNNE